MQDQMTREQDALRAITDVIAGAIAADDRFAGLDLVYEQPGRIAVYGVGYGERPDASGAGVPISLSVNITL